MGAKSGTSSAKKDFYKEVGIQGVLRGREFFNKCNFYRTGLSLDGQNPIQAL